MLARLYVITLLLASCAHRHTPDDTVVVVIDTPMNTADPRYALSNYDAKLSKLVYSGLTAVDTPTGEPRLDLARAIDRIDDQTWDITLRDDARFSDGSPVTAADVARTFASVIAKDSGSLFQRGFEERYAAIDVIDRGHLRFHLTRPIASLLADLDFGILSATDLGAGPYIMRELTGETVELDANLHFYGPHPKTPHVQIRFVRDAAARTLMLVGGSADLLQNSMRPDLVDDIAERPRVQVASAPSSILTYLMMNNEDPALRDVRVRQAIALAIDRRAIVAAQFQGRAVLATGWLPPAYWAYNGDVVHWQRDLPRARQLLAQAGQPHLHLVYKTSSDAFRIAIARVLAAQLAEAGIEVEVRAFEFATFFSDIKRGSFQLATMQSGEDEPDSLYMHFHSTRIPDDGNRDAGNRWRYRNAEVDRLTLDVRRELDPVRRKAAYARVQQILADEVPIVPLWHEDNIVLSARDLAGYAITPNARFAGLVGVVKQRH